ncbi:periplasmic protein TonB [Methylocaldum marinum]|uniref:Periplasmic protein TonB n=1 Tax=Methylocaldum marinum TaxID=1432792 RepID=A0A250KTL7_9GAMM|nr:energy transducer TonB [Methylocaldum marinum]BBA35023.1 periplasmic protein TonB [Methylocaldum marinum]
MSKKTWLRYLPAAIGGVLILLIAVAVFFLKDLFEKPVQTKKQVQQITVIQPPPPPPPPPEEKPPEPEIKEEKIEEPEPEPEPEPEQQADEPPPGEELGVDAEGAAGSDAFGLVGKKGGRGLLGGGGGNAIIWYGQQLQRSLVQELETLLSEGDARKSAYSVILNVWINSEGRVSRAELANSTGKPALDNELREALSKLRISLHKEPPENMPQPLKIRFTSKL